MEFFAVFPFGWERSEKMKASKFTDAQKALNSKLRSECLNAHRFMGLEDTAEKLEAWRRDHNEERPRSAMGSNAQQR